MVPLATTSDRLRPVPETAPETAPEKRVLAQGAAALLVATMVGALLVPFFRDGAAWGWNDWDSVGSHRYITALALRAGELPFWNPYQCGGFPAWGFSEGAVNLVSPYLPLYLTLPLGLALRLEVVGGTLTGAVATYLLAGRLTRSVALRTLVVVIHALNGRWALQVAEGHLWHLQYAWMPLALYFLDGSLEGGARSGPRAWAAGAMIALCIYMGGIYPGPHTALACVLYATFFAMARRSLTALKPVVVLGITAFALAAPKLLPILDLMRRFPRLVGSWEDIGPRQIVAMATARSQTFFTAVVPVPTWEWHEYGIYVGWVGLLVLVAGLVFGLGGLRDPARRGGKAAAFATLGAVFLILGVGNFAPVAPWTLLHHLPIFASHHVPSRFLHPATLFLALAFVGAFEERARPLVGRWDLLALAAVAAVALDITLVGRQAMETAFVLHSPPISRGSTFHHETESPFHYTPRERTDRAVLLAMFANVGALRCYGPPDGVPVGARAPDDGAYRGEVFLASGGGIARVEAWTPSSATIVLEGGATDDLVVYNMNWDDGWQVDGEPAQRWNDTPAVPRRGRDRLTFRYRPRSFAGGLALASVGLAFGLGLALAPTLRGVRRRQGFGGRGSAVVG